MAVNAAPAVLLRWLLVAAAGLLLLLTLPASGEAKAPARASKLGLSQARELRGGRCTVNSLSRLNRAKPLKRRARLRLLRTARKREARRVRRCRSRKTATESVDPVPLYWGAWIGDQLTGEQAPWDMSAVSRFEEIAGKHASIVHFAAPFANCASAPCSFYKFPVEPMEAVREHGSIPFFSWSSQSIPSSVNEPDFQLADVISGAFDSYIREFAEAARDWGHPFFLRFDWEMNDDWFPWSERANGNQPGEFVTAWRHVHDIFTAVGATNATWVWCPYVDPNQKLQDLASLYPGDEYVDWTGLDGYNWGSARSAGWMGFDRVFKASYDRIVEGIAPSKPMIIGEVGSTERGGSKGAWIRDMLDQLPTQYPKVRGVLWFEKYDDGMDWPIETSADARSAFVAGIQASAYQAGDYGSLPPGKIQPPA